MVFIFCVIFRQIWEHKNRSKISPILADKTSPQFSIFASKISALVKKIWHKLLSKKLPNIALDKWNNIPPTKKSAFAIICLYYATYRVANDCSVGFISKTFTKICSEKYFVKFHLPQVIIFNMRPYSRFLSLKERFCVRFGI